MFKSQRSISLLVGVLALSFVFNGCKSNSKELIAAIESINTDTVLAQLADGANPDSKAKNKQTALNITIDKALQYDQERIALFKKCIESIDDKTMKAQLRNSLIKSKRYFDERSKKVNQSKTFSERTGNQRVSEMALSYYLMFADLSNAFKADPTTIKQVIIDTYAKDKTTDRLRSQLRQFAFHIKTPTKKELKLACENYSKAFNMASWLIWVGADITIKNTDGTLPIERLEKAKLMTFAKRLSNGSKRFDKKKIKDVYSGLSKTREYIKKANYSYFYNED